MSTGVEFERRRWRLVAYSRPDGTLASVPDSVEATATFEDGRVTGTGGCNRFTGPYQRDGDRLSIGPLAGTMMACPEPQAGVEAGYHAAAARVTRAMASGHTLKLVDDTGHVQLSFMAASVTPLLATEWRATGINNGKGAVQSLLARTSATAVFGEDGRVSGFAGCNRYAALYRASGSIIAFGPATTSRRACLKPEGVMEQEAAFLAALARATRVAIDGPRLELRDDHGALQVSFAADR